MVHASWMPDVRWTERGVIWIAALVRQAYTIPPPPSTPPLLQTSMRVSPRRMCGPSARKEERSSGSEKEVRRVSKRPSNDLDPQVRVASDASDKENRKGATGRTSMPHAYTFASAPQINPKRVREPKVRECAGITTVPLFPAIDPAAFPALLLPGNTLLLSRATPSWFNSYLLSHCIPLR